MVHWLFIGILIIILKPWSPMIKYCIDCRTSLVWVIQTSSIGYDLSITVVYVSYFISLWLALTIVQTSKYYISSLLFTLLILSWMWSMRVYVVLYHRYYLGGYDWHWSLTFHKDKIISSVHRHKIYDHRWPTTWLVRVHSLKSNLMMQPWARCWYWIISNGW